MTAALGLDWCFGEPRRWHPLIGFGTCALRLEAWLHAGPSASTIAARWRGLWAVLLAVLPPTLLCALLVQRPWGVPLRVAVLYLTIGHRSLRDHAQPVSQALHRAELAAARRHVALIVSRDAGAMRPVDIARAAVESVLENGNDAVFGALFWFALAGAPGALLYRLVNTLDAMWGYRTPRYRYFGWAAARFDDVFNYVPARLTALSYAMVGHSLGALRCWHRQAASWESPNAGPVMAAGAGSLHLSLGGPAIYHGQWKSRPPLGHGPDPQAQDIVRALRLIARAVLLWIAVAVSVQVLWHI